VLRRREGRGEFRVGRLTPGARAWAITWLTVGLVLGVLGLALLLPWKLAVAVFVFIAIGCAIVIAWVDLPRVGVLVIGLFCLAASWDQVAVGGARVRMLFWLLGVMMLAPSVDPRRLPPIPWWLHAYGLAAIVVTCLGALMPIDQSYLDSRYAESASGQSLGTRPSSLGSLLSLLFNNYAIPVTIVLACMCLPKALRWLIGAYVAGVVLSSFAAILGYYGQHGLLDAFGGLPTPAGARASGFTSHPLRLATSEVMATALACWLALQPQWILKWGGRVGAPILILGLYVSGSRGGIVAGMLVLALCMFLLPTVRRRVHLVISAGAAALLGIYFAFPAAVAEAIGSTRLVGGDYTTTVSDTGRSEVLVQGLNDFQTSPIFGIGVKYIAEAHTLYLGVLAAGGVIFGVGYLLFNIGILRTAIRGVKGDRMLGGALLATLLAELWYWTVADLIQTATVAIINGFVIAVWWLTRDSTESPDQRSAGRPKVVGDPGRLATAPGTGPR
jgi:hypothetical protein